MARYEQVWCRWEFVLRFSNDPDLYHSQTGHFTIRGSELTAEITACGNRPPSVGNAQLLRLERYGSPGFFRVIALEE